MAEEFIFRIRSTTLGVVSGMAYGRNQGGLLINSRHVEPYWSGTFSTPPLTSDERKEGLAWLDDCVDLNRRVDFIHPSYQYPIDYDSGSWPMGPTDGTLGSVTNLRTIVVSGLTVGIVLRAGSRLCLIQDDTVCYRKIVETVVVASAIAQSLDIGPRLPPGIFAPGCTVRFAEPFVRMMVIPESWEPEESIDEQPLSFEMMETLR